MPFSSTIRLNLFLIKQDCLLRKRYRASMCLHLMPLTTTRNIYRTQREINTNSVSDGNTGFDKTQQEAFFQDHYLFPDRYPFVDVGRLASYPKKKTGARHR